MDVKLAATVAHLLESNEGKTLLGALGKGSPDTDLNILRAIGIKNPTATDINEIRDFMAVSEQGHNEHMNNITNTLRHILIQDPKTMAIVAGINLAGEAARAVGNWQANNGNRLANAIFEANRTNSDAQNDLYGPSRREKSAKAYGEERRRKGESLKFAMDAIGNTVDKTLGNYNNMDLAARNMAAAQNMPGTPGTLYQLINGMQSRSSKTGRS